MLVMIIHYGVNTPFWDSWDMVALFQKIDHHTLSFGDLWHQHNEHRIFFPLLILLANAYLTHWNTGIEMLISLCFAAATAVLIFFMLKRSIRDHWLSLVAGTLVSAWFFSPVQWQNWLWGWQLEWFMCVAGVVTTVYLLDRFSVARGQRNRKLLFLGAILSSIIATFSLASGVLSWVVGLFLLVVYRQRKRTLGIWTLLGIASVAAYYYHLNQTLTPSGPALKVFIHHPLAWTKFFLALTGGPVGSFSGGGLQTALPGGLQLPLIIGGILLVPLPFIVYTVWIRRKNIRTYAPWLALVLYGLLCSLSTAYGRLGYGMDLVFKSRYTSFTLLYVIGISVLIYILVNETKVLTIRNKKLIVAGFTLVMIPILVSSYAVGLDNFKKQSLLLRQTKFCTHMPAPTDSCLVTTYPLPRVVAPRVEYLKAKHWAGY